MLAHPNVRSFPFIPCVLSAVFTAAVLGQEMPKAVTPGPHEWPAAAIWVHESVGDPPAPPRPIRTAPPAAGVHLRTGPGQSFQVNVAANGENILGDAANEPSLAVDPTDPRRVAIGWRQFDSVTSNFRQGGWGYTTDAGRTWHFPGVLEPGVFRSDPVLRANAQGEFFYFSLEGNFTCDMFKSTNGGQSWGAPVFAYGGDKNWMVIDTTGNASDAYIYGAWSYAAGPYTSTPFLRSVTDGASFDAPFSMPQTPVFGTLAIDPNSVVYVAGIDFPSFSNSNFIVARSANAKLAGTTPTFSIFTVNMGGALTGGTGPNPDGLLGQAWIVADHSGGPRDGYLYMLSSVNPSGADPLDVRFSRSIDGGQTWSASVRVNDDAAGTNAWQWFGTLAIAPNGRLDVVWNDTRNDATPANPTFSEVFYSSSSDAGVTWTTNVAVTPPFNHFLGYPNQNKMGDYFDMTSDNVGANLAYAATFNGEQDVYFMRIGEFDCNGNGVADSADIAGGAATDLNGDDILDACQPLGDVNCDGVTDFADINAFVQALLDPTGYDAAYPGCPFFNRDINGDGTLDFADINPFVTLLLGQ